MDKGLLDAGKPGIKGQKIRETKIKAMEACNGENRVVTFLLLTE